MDICQAVRKDLLSNLEAKYQVDFEYKARTVPLFTTYTNFHWTDSGKAFRIQCREWHEDSSIKLQIDFTSMELGKAINEFYDTGL